ncbi:MAG: hypothetical protein KAZ87_13925 [Spirochaetes bacterium]|nr:hypothetical protein [Spirochaetota bacterium]
MKFFRKNKTAKVTIIILMLISAAAFIFIAKIQFGFLSAYFSGDLKSSFELDISDLEECRNGRLIKEYLLLDDNGKRDFFSKLFSTRKFTADQKAHLVFDNRSEFFCTGTDSSLGGSVYVWTIAGDSIIIKQIANEGFAPFSDSEIWRLNTDGFNYVFKSKNILIFDRFNGIEESLMILQY